MAIKDSCRYDSVEFILQNDTIVRYWPFIMNTKEEIFQDFRDFSKVISSIRRSNEEESKKLFENSSDRELKI